MGRQGDGCGVRGRVRAADPGRVARGDEREAERTHGRVTHVIGLDLDGDDLRLDHGLVVGGERPGDQRPPAQPDDGRGRESSPMRQSTRGRSRRSQSIAAWRKWGTRTAPTLSAVGRARRTGAGGVRAARATSAPTCDPVNWLTDQSISEREAPLTTTEDTRDDFSLSDQQQEHKDYVRKFAREVIRPAAAEHDRDGCLRGRSSRRPASGASRASSTCRRWAPIPTASSA